VPLNRWDYRVVRGPYAGRDCHPLASYEGDRTVKVIFRDCEVAVVILEDLAPRRYGALSDTESPRPVPVRHRRKSP
jgi:hypothetical protein